MDAAAEGVSSGLRASLKDFALVLGPEYPAISRINNLYHKKMELKVLDFKEFNHIKFKEIEAKYDNDPNPVKFTLDEFKSIVSLLFSVQYHTPEVSEEHLHNIADILYEEYPIINITSKFGRQMIENLENGIAEPKTKNFLKICQDCKIDLDQKILVIVSKKTVPLKLSTQNIPNVELISASNINTLSLLKAKQIILTPLAINDIKEIYCD